MKRFSMLLAAGVVASAALFSACSSLTLQTPAQVAAKVCPLLQSEIGTLSQAGVFTGGAAVTLNEKIAPGVDAACAAGATVTVANVQSISSAVAPLLITVVKESGLSQSDQVTAVLAIGTIKGMIDVAFPPATVTAPAASSSAAGAAPAVSASSMATFQSGDVLAADDLNRNFQALNRRIASLEERLQPVLSASSLTVPAVTSLVGAPLQ
ncbi:hypothetical protein [Burkholderia anthina]|uniref:hypothetical protein n=1 Tax=Burkholderia anthina TaxID=179879 RepID=UPI00158F5955|nr:hypothetical protein [Burkholderia anthina]